MGERLAAVAGIVRGKWGAVEWRRRLRKTGRFEEGKLMLFFGARTPQELPYFGPLQNLPKDFIDIAFAFSRQQGQPKTYVQDHGAGLYRRSLYTFMKRTAPAPSMSTFDAPSRESFCVGRGRSDTPLQALALMNDVQHFEAARGFAERLLRRTSSEPERLSYAFRCVTARTPTPAEKKLLTETLAAQRAHFAKHLEAAAEVIANGESKPAAQLPVGEFAAWTMVANLLLNLDEAVTRN